MANAARIRGWGVWLALGGVIAVHATATVLLFPGTSYPATAWIEAFQNAFFGLLTSQPILVAIVAVFWPTRRVTGIAATVALLALLAFAIVIGEGRQGNVSVMAALGLTSMSIVFQIPLRLVRWLCCWRLVRVGETQAVSSDSRFSVRDLLVATTGACVLFGLGRWILPSSVWVATTNNLRPVLREASLMALWYSAGSLASILVVPLALGPVFRAAALRNFLFAAIAMLGAVTPLLNFVQSGGVTFDEVVQLGCIYLGAYASIFVSLSVVRACGFRLIRGADTQPTGLTEAGYSEPRYKVLDEQL